MLLVHVFELCAKGDYALAAELSRIPELTPLERSLRVRPRSRRPAYAPLCTTKRPGLREDVGALRRHPRCAGRVRPAVDAAARRGAASGRARAKGAAALSSLRELILG